MAGFRRKDLKRDRFVEEVSERVEYFSSHRKQFIAGGAAVVLLVAGGVAYGGYARQRAIHAQAALLKAITLYGGVVSTEQVPGIKTFPTESERIAEVTRALDEVNVQYAGTPAATGADYYAGLLDREQGNSTEAKAHFEMAVRGKSGEYPALARLALGGMLLAEGNAEAAREHFQAIADNPTRVISKERASIEVARTFVHSDAQRARDMLSEIQAGNGPASALAADLMETLGEGS
ncbi:MAG: tetratricopeptide repeat protein [Bryobacterales bacterium]|nr:tetratricopeptide repeat protein [Bryobacterales bacterium]